jgi:hypothetical protein
MNIKTKKHINKKINKNNKSQINRKKTYKINNNIIKKETIVSPQMQGGIGNQLFEIAAVYSYVLNNLNTKMIIECNENLSLGHKQKQIEDYKDIPKNLHEIFPNIECYTGKQINWDIYLKQKKTKWYENYELDNYIKKGSKNKLIGVFPSYMFFKNNHNSVLKLFEFSDSIKNIASQNFSNILNHTNTVSLHLRRGDKFNMLIKQKKIFCILDNNYYYKAINKAISDNKNKKQKPLFVLFYEKIDKSYINKNIIPYLKNKNIEYVVIDYSVPAILSMYLISKCKTNIISNSTFSFWGAFLNQNKNKIVYVPEVINSFRDPYKKSMYLRGDILQINKEETMPKDWVRIQTRCI